MYLFLDESGDLGFSEGSSRFFVITIVAFNSLPEVKKLFKAAKKTINKKLNHKNKNKFPELKGSLIKLNIKQYFFNHVENVDFSIYSIALDKKNLFKSEINFQDKIYNLIARKIIDQIEFSTEKNGSVSLVIDKFKSRAEIENFNEYLQIHLEAKLPINVTIDIDHLSSQENYGLQAADLFAHGIFRKYETKEEDWFNIFGKKVKYNEVLRLKI